MTDFFHFGINLIVYVKNISENSRKILTKPIFYDIIFKRQKLTH